MKVTKTRPDAYLRRPAGLEQMFFEIGRSGSSWRNAAAPPTKAEIEKLLAVLPVRD